MTLFSRTIALAASLLFSCAANATVIGFETNNVNSATGWVQSMSLIQCSTYEQNSGYCRGRASGDYVGFIGGTGTFTRTGNQAFTFNGSYMTAAWMDNMSVEVIGYRNSVAVYTQTKVISDDVATYFAFNYQNIDKLTFRAFGGTDAGTPGGGSHIAFDNFTYNEAVGAVPEPASLALFGMGLAGLALARRRNKAV